VAHNHQIEGFPHLSHITSFIVDTLAHLFTILLSDVAGLHTVSATIGTAATRQVSPRVPSPL
jgi:hypothetical protein